MKIIVSGIESDVMFGRYGNGNTAIQLFGSKGTEYEGEAIATATVNGNLKVPSHLVGIKTWSENTGMVETLVNGGVIEDVLKFIEPTGFVQIEYYPLTKEALQVLEDAERVDSDESK